MRAFLARHAHIPPSEFGRMTVTRSREMHTDLAGLVDDEWKGYAELALLIARSGVRL